MARPLLNKIASQIQDPPSEQINPEALEKVDFFKNVVPGQSLTNSPDQPYPWEQPPAYSSVKEASMGIFEDLIEPANLEGILEALINGVSIATLAQAILVEGFRQGQFNPDLMLLLMEPIMYMIMAIAEKFEVPYILYEGEEEEEDFDMTPKQKADMYKSAKNKSVELAKFKNMKPSELRAEAVPAEALEAIKQVELPQGSSLLARQ